MNRYLWWVVIALFVLSLGVIAHMFRFEPLSIAGSGGGTMELWDRWRHRICVVAIGFRGVGCTADELQEMASRQTSTGKEITKQPQSLSEQIRTLRAAGFSEKEIDDWIQNQKKNTGTK